MSTTHASSLRPALAFPVSILIGAFNSRARLVRACALIATLHGFTACHHRGVAATAAEDSIATRLETRPLEPFRQDAKTITARELKNANAKRVEALLAGRVAGVQVISTAAGGFKIRIRGFNSDAEPLYIVDGVMLDVTRENGLYWLDATNILRIDVLKSLAETNIYGELGANGVIRITTKGGSP